MKKIIICLLLSMASLESHALRCFRFTEVNVNDDKVMDIATKAEDLMTSLSNLYESHPHLTPTVSKVIETLIEGIDQSLVFDSSDPVKVQNFLRFRKYIKLLDLSPLIFVEKLHIEFEEKSNVRPDSLNQTLKWADIIEEPQLIVPEKKYLINRLDGSQVTVVFSDKIVSRVIMSSDDFIRTSVSKSFKALESGGSDSTGLVRMIADKTVFEIKFNGKTGNFRFFAYLHEGVFNVVHWSKDSKHSTSTIKRSIESTNGARYSRGH